MNVRLLFFAFRAIEPKSKVIADLAEPILRNLDDVLRSVIDFHGAHYITLVSYMSMGFCGDSPRRDSFQAGFYKPPNETATNHRTEIGKNTGRKSEKLPNGNRKNCRMDIDIRKVYVI